MVGSWLFMINECEGDFDPKLFLTKSVALTYIEKSFVRSHIPAKQLYCDNVF